MSLLRRKSRSLEELLNDPHFPYHVGRLMGASEMAAYWMAIQEDEQTQEMGKRLAAIVSWFYEGERTGEAPTMPGV
jgi:hypothetical protein